MTDVLAMMNGSAAPKAPVSKGAAARTPGEGIVAEGARGDSFAEAITPSTTASSANGQDDAASASADPNREGAAGEGQLPGAAGEGQSTPATFVAGLVALDDVALAGVASDAAGSQAGSGDAGAASRATIATTPSPTGARGVAGPDPRTAPPLTGDGGAAGGTSSSTASAALPLRQDGTSPMTLQGGPGSASGTPATQVAAHADGIAGPAKGNAGQPGALRSGSMPAGMQADLAGSDGVALPGSGRGGAASLPSETKPASNGAAEAGRPAAEIAGGALAQPRGPLRAGLETALPTDARMGAASSEAVETLLAGGQSVGQATRAAALAKSLATSTTQAGTPIGGAPPGGASFDLAALLGAARSEVEAAEADMRGERQALQTEMRGLSNARAGVDGLALGRMFAAPSGAVPLRDFALQVARKASGGATRFQIRLDPPELGRVDVTLEMKGDTATVRLVAERSETLDALARDARGLERALQEAGVRADTGTMEFSLGQDARDGAAGNGARDGSRGPGAGEEAETARPDGPRRAVRADALLDLMI